ncbi:MAG TPA: GNAT family N-acetyltransferase [Acidimicrobiales bacterium]|nr:GNAT family N-acetyltransferase [Acidimicrobiales bacterium]
MSPTIPTTERRVAHLNLIAFNRALTRWSTRGALEEGGGAVLCAGGSWIPVVANGAYRTDDAVDAVELVARADAFFAGLARGFSVKVRDSGEDEDLRRACEAAGLATFGEPTPEMICPAPLPDLEPAHDLSVHWIDDAAGLADFVTVNAEAYATYGMPAEVQGELFDDPAQVLADEAVHIVVVRRGDEPVATALLFESDGTASLQWVGTVSAARGSGLGALVTTLATNLAFSRGASSCSLQASPMGAPIYLALGYETVWHYAEYVRWPKPPGS